MIQDRQTAPPSQSRRLILNPRLYIRCDRAGDEIVGLELLSPVPGAGLRALRSTAAATPRLHRELLPLARAHLDGDERLLELSSSLTARLVERGVLIPEDSVHAQPVLDLAWPEPSPLSSDGGAGPIAIELHPAGGGPEGTAAPAAAMLRASRVLWVRDAWRAIWLPMPCPTAFMDREDGPLDSTSMPLDVQHAIGAVALANRTGPAHLASQFERAHQDFAARGAALVRSVFSPVLREGLARYYRSLIDAGLMPLNDTQSLRYYMHDEPITCFVHRELHQLAQRLVGEPIVPTYSYFSSYPAGSELTRHTDRKECIYTLSVQVDFDPEPASDGATGWPLYVELEGQDVPFDLRNGDGLLFRGTELPHFRRPLESGTRSTSVLFHFVPAPREAA